jgi:hypothetical protein
MNTKETEAKEKEILISKIQEINKKKRHKVRLRQYTYVKYTNNKYYAQGFNLLQKQWDSAEYEQLKRMSLQGVKEVWERIPCWEKPRPPIIDKTKEEKEKQNEDAFKILNKIIPRINNHNS